MFLNPRIDPEGGSLRPWLLGIATNTVRNARRAARRHAAAEEALGIPVGTVRSRLSRARKKLAAAAEKAADKAAEKATGKAAAKNNREPSLRRAQVRDGRTPAARPIQEGNR